MNMDSFEISTEVFDPSRLRRGQEQPATSVEEFSVESSVPGRNITPEPESPQPTEEPKLTDTTKARRTSGRKNTTSRPAPADTTHATENHTATVSHFFGDGRWRIFSGVAFMLAAVYMLIVSISYIYYGAADQSIVQNQTVGEIADNYQGVANAGGWVGALLSHMLMYKWLGIGGFIIIYYLVALSLTMLRLHRFNFWRLTFKSLVSAIALSIITGLITYSSVTPEYWGGEHGYYINTLLIDNASVWGAIAVSLLMLTALILIYIEPVKKMMRVTMGLFHRIKTSMANRYTKSMAAARDSMERERQREVARQTNANENNTTPQPTERPLPETNVLPETEPRATSVVTENEYTPQQQPTVNLEKIPDHIPVAEQPQTSAANIESTVPVPTVSAITESETDSVKVEYTRPVIESVTDMQECPDIANETPTSTQPILTEVPLTPIEETEEIDIEAFDPTAELSHYRFPSLDLLKVRESSYTLDEAEQEENNQRIIRTLNSYGIDIASIKATVGPTITLYEIVPAEGVRISKIKHLGDDMSMSLHALGIRIIAPMPGKGTIGMEVPNKKPQAVSIRSIFSSKAYHESTAELPMALGTTISNEVYVTDLAKMPHLLVAGATGMGKSVGLNTIIASLIYKKHPAELKFVLIDPKMVEFSLYRCLEKHFLAKLPDEEKPIITDPNKVVTTLNSLCLEMDNRYALLEQARVRNIKDYNQKFMSRKLNPLKGHRYLPYIVVIIDEFADLMITAGKGVEEPISRIAAKARAVGIHMILATQRPSVNVITGTIKANFPGRMAFRVTQMNDSRTILDRPGAEQLVGKGDMLISRDGIIDRVQCAFIDTDEVEAVCLSISEQMGYTEAYALPEFVPESSGTGGQYGNAADRDPMYADAGRAVIEAGMGSASMLQRKFNIGYPRAGKLIDQLECNGVVGPTTAAGKPRQVLMTMYDFERSLE